ncbi:hypothetical protein B0H63DRAFT_210824 [Podospora didyma]|uniref:Zn(2)-C6 fungal-type domain-containing protein n=1 Tax=Podospora didyma TaxID=330526 RepID=A0AAE0TW14_9PEZI|nr:hypothetical protein B0H63DRAFT_210824 [Podospora didyma]
MDEKRVAAQVEEVLLQQQSYPSPIVDGSDAQYYHIPAPRDHEQRIVHDDHGLPTLQEHTDSIQEHHEQHELEQSHGHAHELGQVLEHEHDDLHELQELQEPSSPQEHHTQEHHAQEHHAQEHHAHPSASVEELQLAAQLTQGLALPTAVPQNHSREAEVPQEDHDMQGQEDPNHLQEQLQAELQNHDHELQNVQNVLPHEQHEEQPQPHHYVQEPPPPPHIAPHIPLNHLAHQYHIHESTPPRKRTKVSRACDECRRKKIKCDAQSEATEVPCSNCRRSNAQCLFSRVPQKRGPSKGYIKELADRINTIEGQLGAGREGLDGSGRRDSAEVFTSPMPSDENRKRPYSSISGDGFTTPTTDRLAAWATEPRPIRPYIPPPYRPPYTPNDLAPKPATPDGLPEANESALQVQTDSAMLDRISQNFLVPDGLPQPQHHQSLQVDVLREIEDAAFACYLRTVHPTFPILSSTKERISSILSQCPQSLQEAFISAFLGIIQHFISVAQMNSEEFSPSHHLNAWESEDQPRSKVTDLVCLQTLVMMLIESDLRGVAAVKGLAGGPPKSATLGRAVGLAYSMRLHLCVPDPVLSPELDPESDDNVSLRVWWSLIALDRWNAIGTATPLLISNSSVVVLPGLEHIAGGTFYNLMKLAYILGHFIPLALSPSTDLSPNSAPELGSVANALMESFRWQFPMDLLDSRQQPLLHLWYWHVRLLSDLFSSRSRSQYVLQDCTNIVGLLINNTGMCSTLTHHFVALVSLALLELVKLEETRDEATKLARDILDYDIPLSSWNRPVREKIGEKIRSSDLNELADLAAATASENAAGVGGTASVGDDGAGGASKDLPLDSMLDFKQDDDVVENNNINNTHAADGSGDDVFDPSTFLRVGYLTCFEESFS